MSEENSKTESLTGKWSISTGGGQYYGTFDTMEEAIEEGRTYGKTFWVGQCVTPAQPEDLFDGYSVLNWLENTVYEHDDYAGEWAEGAVDATREQCEELAEEITPLIAAWLDRHNLRPRHWIIDTASVRKIEASE